MRTAEKRVIEMAERFGDDEYYSALRRAACPQQARDGKLIKDTVPEKKQYFEDYICDDGSGMGPYRIKCSMWRDKDKVIFDFDGTDPQSISSINFYLNEEMFKMFCGVYMIMVFDPQIMFNDGFYDLMEVHIPEGTLIEAARACGIVVSNPRTWDVFLTCWVDCWVRATLISSRVPVSLTVLTLCTRATTRMASGISCIQSALAVFPGSLRETGPMVTLCGPALPTYPTSSSRATSHCGSRPTRPLQTVGVPVITAVVTGLRMGYCFLEPGTISIHDDRWLTYPWGVNGGLPGRRSEKILKRVDGSEERMPSKCDRIAVSAGDILYFNTWGGGGCGDPLKRETERVEFDVRAGLVSAEGAKRYGVVMTADLTVDEKKTKVLRARMAKSRGKVKMFDRGGDIAELKKRCKKETGLDAPRQPEFQAWALKFLEQQPKAKGRVKMARG